MLEGKLKRVDGPLLGPRAWVWAALGVGTFYNNREHASFRSFLLRGDCAAADAHPCWANRPKPIDPITASAGETAVRLSAVATGNKMASPAVHRFRPVRCIWARLERV